MAKRLVTHSGITSFIEGEEPNISISAVYVIIDNKEVYCKDIRKPMEDERRDLVKRFQYVLDEEPDGMQYYQFNEWHDGFRKFDSIADFEAVAKDWVRKPEVSQETLDILNKKPSRRKNAIKPVHSATHTNTFGKVGRNCPCPCMSGKKFKKCCGR